MAVRPTFIEKLAKLHYGRLARCIALTGNINDLFLLEESGEVNSLPLEEILQKELSSFKYPKSGLEAKFIIIALKSDGIHFVSEKDKKELSGLYAESEKNKAPTAAEAVRLLGGLLRSVAEKRNALEKESSEKYIRPLCIIIDQADMVFPNLDVGRMTTNDKESWMYFCDLLRDESVWADIETADKRPDIIILLSPTVAELNAKLFTLPKVEPVEVALPDEATIKALVQERLKHFPIPDLYGGATDAIDKLSQDARGLTLSAVNDLITAGYRDPAGSPLNRKTVVAEAEKRLLLELRGTVGLVQPEHNLKNIIGFKEHKLVLESIPDWLARKDKAPAGMTVVGPNGAGKTYMIEGWASQMGWTVLNFKGEMKSKWYGEQEIFLEKFEHTASVYGRVCVIVDEAHKAFGSIQKSDTHEAEAQFTRHILQMISNAKYRSRIFWVLITTRPDMLDPDFVRPGRCSLFFPICDPEGSDADDFISWTIAGFKEEGVVVSEEEKNLLKEKSREKDREFSAADFRALRDEFVNRRDYYKKKHGKELTLKEFLGFFKPSAIRIGPERKLQMLLAAKDCAWPELLPAKFRDMNETQISQEINNLKLQFAFE